jgi:hypothetical protein
MFTPTNRVLDFFDDPQPDPPQSAADKLLAVASFINFRVRRRPNGDPVTDNEGRLLIDFLVCGSTVFETADFADEIMGALIEQVDTNFADGKDGAK